VDNPDNFDIHQPVLENMLIPAIRSLIKICRTIDF